MDRGRRPTDQWCSGTRGHRTRTRRRPCPVAVTDGLGPGVFTAAAIVDHAPAWLRPLPGFPIDRLDDARWGQTDLLLQICSDDPVSGAHAARVLIKNVHSRASMAWMQRGFRNAARSHPTGTTMRNLMGKVDGTVNPGPSEFEELVWDDGTRCPWLTGGTSLVLRRIQMELDTWEEVDRPARELTVGRILDTGAPLTGTGEHDDADFTATDQYGISVIPRPHTSRAPITPKKESDSTDAPTTMTIRPIPARCRIRG